VSFLSVGDVMLSRHVAGVMKTANDPLLPFAGMSEVFASVDFSFGNLESPFSGKDFFSLGPAHIFNAPRWAIAGLVKHRFRVMSLANNHALDQAKPGLWFTFEHLRKHDIAFFGAGRNAKQAWTPAVVEVRGVRIGFLGASYASINDSGKTWLQLVARIEDKGRLKRAISALKTKCDFIVASMHAGIEYVPKPFGPQILFAKAAIDAGADVVIGAHPHVVQTVDRYRGKYIFYSLGNFIFDHTKPHTDEGVAVKTILRATPKDGGGKVVALDRYELIPFVIENRSSPRPIDGARAAAILKRMKVSGNILR